MKKKQIPKLKIRPYRAYGNEAEQTWFFLNYPDTPSYECRAYILRKYSADGSSWFGLKMAWDTHENGLPMMIEEIKLAKKAIVILRKSWKKYLQI